MKVLQVTLAAIALGCAAPRISQADTYPNADAYGDAADVDLIVEARWVGEDRVAVVRTLFAAVPLPNDVRELTVEGLSRHDRRLEGFADSAAARTLETSDVVLLLDRSKDGTAWRPHNLILETEGASRRSTGGATGTFWLKDDAVWCYVQTRNPGPFVLHPWPAWGKSQATPQRLREEIAAGVAARREWEADLAIPDAAERASRLLRWLRPSTSPDDARHTRRRHGVREVMAKIGRPAVPALVRALDPVWGKDAREVALLALADLKSAAVEATPSLLVVATTPGDLALSYIAYALRYAGDERAIRPLRDLLAQAALSDGELLRHAAFGLVEHRDPEAATRIASRLPASPAALESPYGLLELLEALQKVDRARAKAWLLPWAAHALFAHSRERVDRLLRD